MQDVSRIKLDAEFRVKGSPACCGFGREVSIFRSGPPAAVVGETPAAPPYRWVMRRSGNLENERCDELAAARGAELARDEVYEQKAG